MRSSRGGPSVGSVLTVLFVLSPILIPIAIVAAVFGVFFVLMVVQAFGEGFEVGLAALGALIGIPSVAVLWLQACGRVLGVPRRVPTTASAPVRATSEVAARYASGDFEHRDYEAEQREYLQWRREQGW